MSDKISNKIDRERIDADIEKLMSEWLQRGEKAQEVAIALQSASLMLFVGHGFTPEFLGKITEMGAENQRETINKVAQERIDNDLLTVCKWKDTENFSASAQ